ncbi:hypothetical protein BE17_07260 [Sorangium cellulosum]|uniref:Uncharacterized protein n=1 Tax=Sorangium cellulosum TaxID=56 RepID=A0A150S504_SORCE|nr:hypothetical protein BE17_07260 [Sorangium cellulosum]
MSRSRRERRAAERAARKATQRPAASVPGTRRTGAPAELAPELQQGFRAIRAYVERTPSLPDDLGNYVAMAFEVTNMPGATRVMLYPREIAIMCAIFEGKAELAIELAERPITGELTIVATSASGRYAIGSGQIFTAAAGLAISAPGGVA